MAFRIIDEGRGVNAVYQGRCSYCGCRFEFNIEDVQSQFFDQRERYNVLECAVA